MHFDRNGIYSRLEQPTMALTYEDNRCCLEEDKVAFLFVMNLGDTASTTVQVSGYEGVQAA